MNSKLKPNKFPNLKIHLFLLVIIFLSIFFINSYSKSRISQNLLEIKNCIKLSNVVAFCSLGAEIDNVITSLITGIVNIVFFIVTLIIFLRYKNV